MAGQRERDEFTQKVPDLINKPVLASFTTDLQVAYDFATSKNLFPAYIIRVIMKKPIPAINFTTGNFQSEFGPGGAKYIRGKDEKEVLLPPGKYRIRSTTDTTFKDRGIYPGNVKFINCEFIPTPHNTRYLHLKPTKPASPVVVSKLPSFGFPSPSPKSPSPPKSPSSGQVNRKGRVIQKGPKGGMYVLSNTGKKIYKSMLPTTTSVNAPFGKNKKNRVIQKGPKGGKFVVGKHGKKLYKFF
jgi:hypothetical protein